LKAIPRSALQPLNKIFGPNTFTKFGDKQGKIVLAQILPYVMGGAIGGGYGFATAWPLIGASRRAFGPPKTAFDADDAGTGAYGDAREE
jgi:hypothetical protein